ncbi:MAG: gliding motility-associated C-terminal domain-containing protein [Lewinellaceae bacterium]|nr:gliding motility-associated C-terminal domain-containing protein [Lewinellaceae bacterium]
MRILLFCLLFCGVWSVSAQSIQVVNACGGKLSGPDMTVEFSIGEPAIETLFTGQEAVTQGFIQPDYFGCLASLEEIIQTICAGETYLFNGQALKVSGQYEATYTNLLGCDSTVVLQLEVLDPQGFAAEDDEANLFLPATSLMLHPLDNDLLPPGFSAMLTFYSQAYAGTVVSPDSVALLYNLQNSGFTGQDSFRYAVCLRQCLQAVCDTAWVYVLVTSDLSTVDEKDLTNTITPNGDGLNDVFDPLQELIDQGKYVSVNQARLSIFNRWGERIFYNKDTYKPWDGRAGGKQIVPQGTYYYILRLELNDALVVKGPINVFGTNE